MRPPSVARRAAVQALVAGVVAGLGATAATLTVDDDAPADFSSIQAAINAASNGDEIVVKPGRYRETLSFLGKAITVRSEAGARKTVVFLEGETRIVLLDGDSTLRGFTITGGRQRVGGGILVTGGADPVIEDNVIEGNTAVRNDVTGLPGMGGGIAVEALCRPVITRNVIRGNGVLGDSLGFYGYGGAIEVGDDASAVITSNLIVDNEASQIGGGIYVGLAGASSPVVITNNTIVDNLAGDGTPDTQSFGGGMSVYDGAQATIQNNAITGNASDNVGGGAYFFANNTTGLDYKANDYDANQPDDCAGLPASKCNGGQFFFPPLYLGPAAADYRLRSDSELLDRGVAGSQGSLDLDRRTRTVDSDLDGTAVPDIGAFENQGEITGLGFSDKTTLIWHDSRNVAVVFDLYRGLVSGLAPGPLAACWQAGHTTTMATDSEVPPLEDGFYYLAGGRDQVSGSLGFDGQGNPRASTDPCP